MCSRCLNRLYKVENLQVASALGIGCSKAGAGRYRGLERTFPSWCMDIPILGAFSK